jgi:hypothetical protein
MAGRQLNHSDQDSRQSQDESKTTAEVHDYLDERTGVLAAMLAKRAPGYTGLGFPDPRRIALTPSASTDGQLAL